MATFSVTQESIKSSKNVVPIVILVSIIAIVAGLFMLLNSSFPSVNFWTGLGLILFGLYFTLQMILIKTKIPASPDAKVTIDENGVETSGFVNPTFNKHSSWVEIKQASLFTYNKKKFIKLTTESDSIMLGDSYENFDEIIRLVSDYLKSNGVELKIV